MCMGGSTTFLRNTTSSKGEGDKKVEELKEEVGEKRWMSVTVVVTRAAVLSFSKGYYEVFLKYFPIFYSYIYVILMFKLWVYFRSCWLLR